MKYIELGDARVPFEANLGFTQTYEDAKPRKLKYYASGNPRRLKSNVAKKIKTVMSAPNGVWPDSFDGLDWDAVLLLKCARERIIDGATNVITIPAARRSDAGYEPFGFALVGNRKVPAAITAIAGDQYTLASNPGATRYGVGYYPQFNVLASKKSTGKYGWLIEAVETT